MSKAISFRQRQVCAYCGRTATTRDHIIPKALVMSPLGPSNLVPACVLCNQIKGAMTPAAMRQLAADQRAMAARVEEMADIVAALMVERGLDALGIQVFSNGEPASAEQAAGEIHA